jgi:hypothetical protein
MNRCGYRGTLASELRLPAKIGQAVNSRSYLFQGNHTLLRMVSSIGVLLSILVLAILAREYRKSVEITVRRIELAALVQELISSSPTFFTAQKR